MQDVVEWVRYKFVSLVVRCIELTVFAGRAVQDPIVPACSRQGNIWLMLQCVAQKVERNYTLGCVSSYLRYELESVQLGDRV